MQMTAEDRLPSLFEMTLNNPKQQGRTRFTPAIAARADSTSTSSFGKRRWIWRMLKICIWGRFFFRWELWPNPPESQVIVWSFQNLARDVFGSFLFHNTHMTPRGCHVWSETDGRHIDNQKETYSLGRWFGKLNSLHNIGRPEIFRWIMRVMFLEFSITKRNVGFRVVAKDDWWYVPLRTILPLRTVNFWSTNIHPSHRFASWLQPKSDQNFLRPRGRVKQMSTGGFFQSFRYVSLTVETSNES